MCGLLPPRKLLKEVYAQASIASARAEQRKAKGTGSALSHSGSNSSIMDLIFHGPLGMELSLNKSTGVARVKAAEK